MKTLKSIAHFLTRYWKAMAPVIPQIITIFVTLQVIDESTGNEIAAGITMGVGGILSVLAIIFAPENRDKQPGDIM